MSRDKIVFLRLRQTFPISYCFSPKYLYFEPHCNIFALFWPLWIFVLLNICALEYLCSLFFSVINIACVLLIFLCAVKLFVLRRFVFPNGITLFTSHDEHIYQKTLFFKSSLFQAKDSAVFEEVSKNSSTNSQKVY